MLITFDILILYKYEISEKVQIINKIMINVKTPHKLLRIRSEFAEILHLKVTKP